MSYNYSGSTNAVNRKCCVTRRPFIDFVSSAIIDPITVTLMFPGFGEPELL